MDGRKSSSVGFIVGRQGQRCTASKDQAYDDAKIFQKINEKLS